MVTEDPHCGGRCCGNGAGSTYSVSQLIAADFNQSGAVTAADAADILSYIVDGEKAGVPVPEWVYVNESDITKGDATDGSNFNGSHVIYDEVVDLFAYAPINLTDSAVNSVAAAGSLTGILRGDVTSSYDAAHDAATTVLAQVGAINTPYHMGVFNPTMTAEATAGSGTYTAAATVTGAET